MDNTTDRQRITSDDMSMGKITNILIRHRVDERDHDNVVIMDIITYRQIMQDEDDYHDVVTMNTTTKFSFT